MTYTHLFTETHYSMSGSNITSKALVQRAKELGFSSLSITDTKMHGVVDFYQTCIKNQIKPIIGLQVRMQGIKEDSVNHVLLYAKNNEGYQALLQISTEEATKNVVSLTTLQKHKSNLIAVYLTNRGELMKYYQNKMKNEYQETLTLLQETFGGCFFNVSRETSLDEYFEERNMLIYTSKVQYLEEQDAEVSVVLKKVFNQGTDDLFDEQLDLSFKPFNKKDYKYLQALKNVEYVIDQSSVTLTFDQTYLPSYPVPQKVSSKDYLHALVMKGFEKRFKGKKLDKKEYLNRINFELNVIDSMGYNDYFLIVWDFVKYARKKKYLVGPGRGSAAASLVSYCLGITSVDSIKFDLVFERFLNPERITLPDIDMDLPDTKRDDIIRYVSEFYGQEKVASICTFGTFQKRSAIRDTARVLQIEGMIIDEVIKSVTEYPTIKDALKESVKLQNIVAQSEPAKQLVEISSRIEGLNRHISTHAAGIIVGSSDLTKHTALQPGLLDMNQTQYEAKDLEKLGLLKIDFLGLRNLTIIDDILQQIKINEKKDIDIYKVPLDDKNTFDLLQRVDVTGVFQLESKGMRSLIGQMQMKEFEDIVTVLALFRPGPMENIPSYIKRRFEQEKVTYPHPVLEEVLKPTNGIIIYQEQIVKIASLFAGYTLGEADVLRRAVSKKEENTLQQERSRFISKAIKEGHTKEVSNEIYDYIVKFSNYGFNRAHSVAYAMVSYWMAYLKANYPKYFISILTSSVIGDEKQTKAYIYEAYKLGVKILPPSINRSTNLFVPEGSNLRYPLLGIKHVGVNAVHAILEERETKPFTSFVDAVSRLHKVINKRVMDSLIKAGAFDEFQLTKRTMLEKVEDVINFQLLGEYINSDDFVIENKEEFEFEYLQQFEQDTLGFNLTMNPLYEYQDYIKKNKLEKPSTIKEEMVGTEIRIIGIIQYIKQIKTKTNKDMAFVTIQDEYSAIESVLFERTFKEVEDILKRHSIYVFKAKVESRNNNLQLIINRVHPLQK